MMEILSKIPKNLTSSPVLGEKKEWIATAAMLAGSVASSLFGANKAKKAARKAQKENTYRSNAEKAWYDKNYNTDYLDTKAGQNLMRRAQEVQNEYIRKADGAAAVGGGTAASVAAVAIHSFFSPSTGDEVKFFGIFDNISIIIAII